MRITVATMAALLSISTLAAPQEPITFKGHPIGAPREAVIGSFPALRCPELDNCRVIPKIDCGTREPEECLRVYSYGGAPLNWLGLRFEEDRLVSVAGSFPTEHFNDIRDAARARFGPPTRTPAPGVELWLRRNDYFVLRRITSRSGESAVSLANRAWIERQGKPKTEDRTQERAKDL